MIDTTTKNANMDNTKHCIPEWVNSVRNNGGDYLSVRYSSLDEIISNFERDFGDSNEVVFDFIADEEHDKFIARTSKHDNL